MVAHTSTGLNRRQILRPFNSLERTSHSKLRFLVLIPLFFVLYVSAFQQLKLFNQLDFDFNIHDQYDNVKEMKQWRDSTQYECLRIIDNLNGTFDRSALNQKEAMEAQALSKIYLPDSPSLRGVEVSHEHRKYQYCRNTFIDLGTNIGDSIGYFVDNSIDVCTPLWMNATTQKRITNFFPKLHLDITERKVTGKGSGGNPLMGLLQKHMGEGDGAILPEEMCVYGMEGNPTFTERLRKLQNFILGMRPRPESVVSAEEGPTTLFLDQISVEQNFWGSSILKSQQDAQKTAEQNNGTLITAPVQGIQLSRLVHNTMLPFKPGATDEEQRGGLLIIKMDIEGAEYQVLKEVANSGILCDYVSMGNKVVLIVEFHNMSITDGDERRREKDGSAKARKNLAACGVEFGNLHAHWK